MRVSASASPALRATLLALRTVDRDVRRDVRQQTRGVARPEWERALDAAARTTQESRMIADTARIAVSDQNVRVRAGRGRTPKLSGGATPTTTAKGFEFGSNRYAQFPRPRRAGPFYRTVANMGPRLLALWTQTTLRRIHLSLEGRR